MRHNPYLEVKNGQLMNPDSDLGRWYHGSWIGKMSTFKPKSPRDHAYKATFFTSSDELAEDFASGEKAWLYFDESPPRMKKSGYVHNVAIADVPLIDADRLFTDRATLVLSDEGVRLVRALQDAGAADELIEDFIQSLSVSTYRTFLQDGNPIWPHLLEAMIELGYRGWFEKESIRRSHINIALLYPHQDASIRGGYVVPRTRKFR